VGSRTRYAESLPTFVCMIVYDSFFEDYTWTVYLFPFLGKGIVD
jgi:hypothetical protein